MITLLLLILTVRTKILTNNDIILAIDCGNNKPFTTIDNITYSKVYFSFSIRINIIIQYLIQLITMENIR